MNKQRESVKVLQECIDLQNKKSQDYQNPNSSVVQADYYRRGIDSIHDMIHTKVLRAQSLIEGLRGQDPKFESLEDTYKDLINYCSFAVSYLRYSIDGQLVTRDIFNQNMITDTILNNDTTVWQTTFTVNTTEPTITYDYDKASTEC